MPNHIKNRLTFSGNQNLIEKMLNLFSTIYPAETDKAHDGRIIYENKITNEYGWLNSKTGEFETGGNGIVSKVPNGFEIKINPEWTRFPDFNKIIPMPESLHAKTNSEVENAIKNTLKIGFHKNELIGFLERENRSKTKSPLELNDEDWNDFIVGLNNVRKYGFLGWYEWSIKNWGTKWNSYSNKKLSDLVYEFETAWSAVPDLIEKMSLLCPKVAILYEWSDEDTGSNCGYASYLHGEISLNELKNGSNDAYEMAFKLRPNSAEGYKIVNGKYKYFEKE